MNGNKKNESAGAAFAPLRPFDEFLLDGQRFELPKFNDLERWNKRIISNLLYFQTNYFLSFFIIVAVGSCYDARSFCFGSFFILISAAGYLLLRSEVREVADFRRDHPKPLLAGIVCAVVLLFLNTQHITLALFILLLPLLAVLTHASIRLRGLQNKANQLAESLHQRTPMARLLTLLNIPISSFSISPPRLD